MASVQPDLHKFFKNKKHSFNKNGIKKDFNCEIQTKQIDILKEELKNTVVGKVLDTSSITVCNDVPSSASEEKVSNSANKKRKLHEIEVSQDESTVTKKKFFLEKQTKILKHSELQVNKTGQNSADDKEIEKVSETKELKKQLGKCSNIHELREKLIKFKKCESKLSDFRKNISVGSKSPGKSSQLKYFRAIDIEVPISPSKTPTKLVRTPIKSIRTPKKLYCHERYASLATEESNLALPFKYEHIKEVFRAVDTIVSLLHNRQEIITFAKLKPAVQEMMRKAFYKLQLGQMKTVFPLAYFFRQEKLNTSHHGGSAHDYHLTISANLKYKKTAARNLFGTPTNLPEKPVFKKMDSIVLVDRRKIFHEALLNILKSKHEAFLKTLDPPIELYGKEVKNWHPEFSLEEVADLEPSPLPVAPVSDVAKTANEIFAKASSLFSINNRMKNALENVATKINENEEKPKVTAPSVNVNREITTALKGISLSLLEKIRAREAAKATREMTRSTEQTMELEMRQRLPEIARIIRNFFIAEKKAALSWELVSAKVASSYRSMMAASDVDAHLELLIKAVPGWCTLHIVRCSRFVKIDKNREMQCVLDVLQNEINKL